MTIKEKIWIIYTWVTRLLVEFKANTRHSSTILVAVIAPLIPYLKAHTHKLLIRKRRFDKRCRNPLILFQGLCTIIRWEHYIFMYQFMPWNFYFLSITVCKSWVIMSLTNAVVHFREPMDYPMCNIPEKLGSLKERFFIF